MCKNVLITGVKVKEQQKRARVILKTLVIPKEEKFFERKRKGLLSQRLIVAMKENA